MYVTTRNGWASIQRLENETSFKAIKINTESLADHNDDVMIEV
jgi:hypothetical protein